MCFLEVRLFLICFWGYYYKVGKSKVFYIYRWVLECVFYCILVFLNIVCEGLCVIII